MIREKTYFVSDTHLGLDVKHPEEREKRFVDFLKGIPAAETEAVYLLGDIWDFWYEWRDVVPKGYTRVFAALQDHGAEAEFISVTAGGKDLRFGQTVSFRPRIPGADSAVIAVVPAV